jgi:thymidine kinase
MSLTLVISPMYSGKTTFLLNKIVAFTKLGFKTLYVNHSLDTRNNDSAISCHNKLLEAGVVSCNFDVIRASNLHSIVDKDKDYFFIDEFQFFDHTAVAIILNLIEKGKHVFVAGLKGDFENKEFGNTLKLIPHADNIHFLKSLCVECAREGKCVEAPFTKYYKKEDHEQITVGSDELYIPVCRQHHKY